ncbi:Hypothetical predicted protein [Olea europaea subsp. europaea]|uniref:Uncharacterized protein n=1 Tax=Olea europaea subsp. europaea TaxID=158383 RepID=A0A8S0QND3_OLEEU|nr:Hypothetical predicted protein [Olea europaea subsp. europaea]
MRKQNESRKWEGDHRKTSRRPPKKRTAFEIEIWWKFPENEVIDMHEASTQRGRATTHAGSTGMLKNVSAAG